MKYWRKDIVGQEESFKGHPLEIAFLLQVLDSKDKFKYHFFITDGVFSYDEIIKDEEIMEIKEMFDEEEDI